MSEKLVTVECKSEIEDGPRVYARGAVFTFTASELKTLQKKHPDAFVTIRKNEPARRDKAMHNWRQTN